MMSQNKESMKRLEEEVRQELGIRNVGPQMTTEEAGKIGGYMVKRLIQEGEQAEQGRGGQGMRGGERQGM